MVMGMRAADSDPIWAIARATEVPARRSIPKEGMNVDASADRDAEPVPNPGERISVRCASRWHHGTIIARQELLGRGDRITYNF